MPVLDRIVFLKMFAMNGVKMSVSFSSNSATKQDKICVKVFGSDASCAQSSIGVIGALDLLYTMAFQGIVTDRGHKHSDGSSEVCFWIRHGITAPCDNDAPASSDTETALHEITSAPQTEDVQIAEQSHGDLLPTPFHEGAYPPSSSLPAATEGFIPGAFGPVVSGSFSVADADSSSTNTLMQSPELDSQEHMLNIILHRQGTSHAVDTSLDELERRFGSKVDIVTKRIANRFGLMLLSWEDLRATICAIVEEDPFNSGSAVSIAAVLEYASAMYAPLPVQSCKRTRYDT